MTEQVAKAHGFGKHAPGHAGQSAEASVGSAVIPGRSAAKAKGTQKPKVLVDPLPAPPAR
jgi:hypothetical protein